MKWADECGVKLPNSSTPQLLCLFPPIFWCPVDICCWYEAPWMLREVMEPRFPCSLAETSPL